MVAPSTQWQMTPFMSVSHSLEYFSALVPHEGPLDELEHSPLVLPEEFDEWVGARAGGGGGGILRIRFRTLILINE